MRYNKMLILIEVFLLEKYKNKLNNANCILNFFSIKNYTNIFNSISSFINVYSLVE